MTCDVADLAISTFLMMSLIAHNVFAEKLFNELTNSKLVTIIFLDKKKIIESKNYGNFHGEDWPTPFLSYFHKEFHNYKSQIILRHVMTTSFLTHEIIQQSVSCKIDAIAFRVVVDLTKSSRFFYSFIFKQFLYQTRWVLIFPKNEFLEDSSLFPTGFSHIDACNTSETSEKKDRILFSRDFVYLSAWHKNAGRFRSFSSFNKRK